MSKVGIIAALPAEAKCLHKKTLPVAEPIEIGKDIFLCLSGIGHEAAKGAVKSLFSNDVKALVSWGVAGALKPELKSGDLLIANNVVNQDVQYECSADWSNRINSFYSSLPCNVVRADIISTKTVCSSISEKENLAKKTEAYAMDMESAAIGETTKQLGMDFIIIRAIADTAKMPIPVAVLNHTNELGQPDLFGFLGSCLREPGQILHILRLAGCFKSAIHTLKLGTTDLKKQGFLYNT